MSKLQNIKAVKQMIDGSHRTQTKKTFGFSDIEFQRERNKTREVGEIWEEKDAEGKTVCWWEQHEGFKSRYNIHPDLSKEFERIRNEKYAFPNCQKETCTCKKPTRLDEKFRRLMGMCHDCLVTLETKLKIEGKFGEYAMKKMQENAKKFFEEKDQELTEIKKTLQGPISYVAGADGIEEKWEVENPEEMIQTIETNYNKYKDQILGKFEEKS